MSIGAATMQPSIVPAPGPDPAVARRIQDTVAQLRTTEHGRGVGDFLVQSRMNVRVVDNVQFRGEFPGAGAIYDARSREIIVPRGALDRPEFVTTLAHEATHARDFADRPAWGLQVAGLLGNSAKDAGTALVTFHNPVTAWLDSLTARQNEDEVNAYHLQAQVAAELGRNESSWALGQGSDGSVLSVDETRGRVATSDLYRMDPMRRLVLGGGIAIGATSAAAFGVSMLAHKLRPSSYLGSHMWPVYAVVGGLATAWVAGDQVRAHRLATDGAD
jgi:hypothetical protein